MLLQAAADTGELALHTAHFTVPTELHTVNGEWNSVRQKNRGCLGTNKRLEPRQESGQSVVFTQSVLCVCVRAERKICLVVLTCVEKLLLYIVVKKFVRLFKFFIF